MPWHEARWTIDRDGGTTEPGPRPDPGPERDLEGDPIVRAESRALKTQASVNARAGHIRRIDLSTTVINAI